MSIYVDGLSKRYTDAGTPAVEAAGFSAPDGAITSLLGPSGSGKTTVLRLIAGLETPDAGTIRIGDVDLTDVPVRRRGVGVVFQGYALFQNMTVRENIAFSLRIRKLPRPELDERVDELLSLVQLSALSHRHPSELSGGQQQRVAFARALAPRPRVLLLDEPFGALDTQVRVELREWLRDLHTRTHVTTLLVTHDQEEALELSEHVVLMDKGRVVQAGAPHALYDHPESSFVAGFLGGANVLSGRVGGGRVEFGALSVAAPAGSREGSTVRAYVRPHEVRITAPRASGEADGVSSARVERLVRVGGFVKVELRLTSSETMTVQLPMAEHDALGLRVGVRVIVDIEQAKVFLVEKEPAKPLVGDYSI